MTNPAAQTPNQDTRRQYERVAAELPIQVDGIFGVTRDVSAGGIFFEFENTAAVGSEISFDIEMHTALGPMRMKCRGQIVRSERHGTKTGIAVKTTESRLEALNQQDFGQNSSHPTI
jgi:hypothetical protein